MKKITLIFILFYNLTLFGQEYEIQIRLVDGEIGYPIGGNYYEPISNDAGLNNIFDTYGATAYISSPGSNGVPEWSDRTHHVQCNGCDINQFEQALDNYNAVVERADQTEPGTQSNGLFILLLDLDNGNTTGNTTPEGIVITNNNVLNSIFVDYTVLHFEQAYPSSQNPDVLRAFFLGCDCMAVDLKPILEAETGIIEAAEQMDYVVLDIADVESLDFQFYPNPVEDNIVINSSEKIGSYEIINLFGQSIFKGASSESINEYLPSISVGTYLLKVMTDSGKQQTLRFIKK